MQRQMSKCVFWKAWIQSACLRTVIIIIWSPSSHCALRLSRSLMLPCRCGTNQDSALGLWPVHSSTSLWLRAGVLDTLFSPFLVILPSLNLWHDYFVFQSHYYWANKEQQRAQLVHAELVRQSVNKFALVINSFEVAASCLKHHLCPFNHWRWTSFKRYVNGDS